MPPVGWSDLARQHDIALVRSEMAELRTELRGEIAAVRGEIAALRTELKSDILQLSAELSAHLPKLYRANFAGAIGLAGLVLAAAKLA